MTNKQLQTITEENFVETLEHNKFKPFLFNMYQRTQPEKITIGINALPSRPKYMYRADGVEFERDDFQSFLTLISLDIKLKSLSTKDNEA